MSHLVATAVALLAASGAAAAAGERSVEGSWFSRLFSRSKRPTSRVRRTLPRWDANDIERVGRQWKLQEQMLQTSSHARGMNASAAAAFREKRRALKRVKPSDVPVACQKQLTANSVVVATTEDFKMAVYASGDIVSKHLREDGAWELAVIESLSEHLQPNSVVVDIGANVGWYTFNFAKGHDVVAFEPFRSNLALINATRCLNPALAARIQLNSFGLSHRPQRCDMYQVPKVNFGDTVSMCGASPAELRANVKKLNSGSFKYVKLGESRMERLDDVASAQLLGSHKVVKMDVEGHEYEVLQGARRFFTEGSPPAAVLAEVFQLGPKLPKFNALMKEWNYTAFPAAVSGNSLFLHGASEQMQLRHRLANAGKDAALGRAWAAHREWAAKKGRWGHLHSAGGVAAGGAGWRPQGP